VSKVTDYKLPFDSIENDFLRLDYLTTVGPRIVGLYVRGVEGNLLASTPEVHWETPHGEYYLRGGHRLWCAPENSFYMCPEDNLEVINHGDEVILRGKIELSGLQKEISFHLDQNCVRLLHKLTWQGNKSVELAPWAITQLRLGGMAILPLPGGSSLLPDRNFVLWPYSQIRDERLELHDDLVILHGVSSDHAFKIGSTITTGWIAGALGDALFAKRFPVDMPGVWPDRGCNVEAYVKDACIELETLGPLKTFMPGESVMHEETWELFTGSYPAEVESARKILNQLS
jgi:hypothetical protein